MAIGRRRPNRIALRLFFASPIHVCGRRHDLSFEKLLRLEPDHDAVRELLLDRDGIDTPLKLRKASVDLSIESIKSALGMRLDLRNNDC